MHLSTLADWLTYIANIHPQEIELGLARVKAVATLLGIQAPRCPVIVVGGTNGKGSTVCGLEKIYRGSGYRVGAFTSPMLFSFNEQVRVDGREARDEEICAAFEKIEDVRGKISLTPFEFHTLAALLIFSKTPLDVVLLEVGLGGRLDAVNIIDADLAIVTRVDMDHMDYLGHTREDIGFEKAGIFRANQRAICGDANPPHRLLDYAARLGTQLFCQQRDFRCHITTESWSWQSEETIYENLPIPKLAIENMSTVLMAVELMQPTLPVEKKNIIEALSTVCLPGRIEVVLGTPIEIFDVSHNPAAIAHLAERLKEMPCRGKTHAVFSMLSDKDISTSIDKIQDKIDIWHVAPLTGARATRIEKLKEIFSGLKNREINWHTSIAHAYQQAKKNATQVDRIIVFGSFHTVQEARKNA